MNEMPFSEGMNCYVNQLLTKSIWLKNQKMIIGKGSFSGEELEPLTERMRKVEKEIGEDGTRLRMSNISELKKRRIRQECEKSFQMIGFYGGTEKIL